MKLLREQETRRQMMIKKTMSSQRSIPISLHKNYELKPKKKLGKLLCLRDAWMRISFFFFCDNMDEDLRPNFENI